MEQVTYDAFISYSHSDPDAQIARKLHSLLEHYHIPKKIQRITGKKRFARVFRDREELTLSPDLGANIKSALEHSEFLIVVCSPRSVKSEWVQKEIRTFLESHEKEKILAILADGEPEEAFPGILCYREEKRVLENGEEVVVRIETEPMAADVRGKDQKERDHKLKQEFLRIAAPILSCTYDSLRQRHREYMFRRMMAAAGAGTAAALLFSIYVLYQSQETKARYEEARRNQARYLSGISGELLQGGDRERALLTALAITPEDEDAVDPVVPEQMYALNNALYTYDHSNTISFKPDTAYRMEGQAVYLEQDTICLNEEETGCFCTDQLGNAYVLNPENGECLWKITQQDISEAEGEPFTRFIPASGTKAVLLTESQILLVDWKTQKTEKSVRIEGDGSHIDPVACAVRDRLVVVADGQKIWVYDLASGTCIQEKYYVQEEGENYKLNALSFSEDGEEILLGVEDRVYTQEEPQRGLLRFQVKSGGLELMAAECAEEVLALPDGLTAAVHYIYTDTKERTEDAPRKRNYIAVYDTGTGERIWKSEEYITEAFSNTCILSAETMEMEGEEQEVLFASVKNKVTAYKLETGEVIQEKSYAEDVINIQKYDPGRMLVGMNDGGITIFVLDGQNIDFEVSAVAASTEDSLFSREHNTVVWTVGEERNIVFGRQFSDSSMESTGEQTEADTVEYFTVEGLDGAKITYRCVICRNWDETEKTDLIVYQAGEAEELFRYTSEEANTYLSDLAVTDLGGKPYLLFQVYQNNSGTRQMITADLASGNVAVQEEEDLDWLGTCDQTVFHGTEKIVLWESSAFVVADISGDGIVLPDAADAVVELGNEESVWDVQVSADDRYIAILVVRYDESGDASYGLKVWDTAAGEWTEIAGKQTYGLADDFIKVGWEENVVAGYREDGTIAIINMENGEVISSLEYGNFSEIDFGFLNHDRYLVSLGDRSYLTLWDVDRGVLLMQESGDAGWNSAIYTDGSESYFKLGSASAYSASDKGFTLPRIRIYSVLDGRFYRYADVPYGEVSFRGGEIFCRQTNTYTHFYDYQELKKRAETVLDGKRLDAADERKYFIS